MTLDAMIAETSERRVLAALVSSPGTAVPVIRAAGLRSTDFGLASTAAGFEAAMSLVAAGRTPDVVAIVDAVSSKLVGDDTRGWILEELADLASLPGTTADLRYFADQIRDLSIRRRAHASLRGACARLEDLNGDPTAPELAAIGSDLRDLAETASRPASASLTLRTVAELSSTSLSAVEWIVEGMAAVGEVSLLASAPKVGKTTFFYALLKALETGAEFCGLPTAATSAVILSEEAGGLVLERCRDFNLSEHAFLVREDYDPSTPWPDLMQAAADEAIRRGAKLICVDTLARFTRLGRDAEKDSGAMEEVIQAALVAAGRGLAVLLIHHHRKAEGSFGEQIRGSSAILGAVDTVIEMRRLDNQADSTRTIELQGRHKETPTDPITVQLTGGRYVRLGSPAEVRGNRAKEKVVEVLTDAEAPLTRDQICDAAGGRRADIGAAVYKLATEGHIEKAGAGKKGCPFTYFLPLPVPACPSTTGHRDTPVSCPPVPPPYRGQGEKETLGDTRTGTLPLACPGTGNNDYSFDGAMGDLL